DEVEAWNTEGSRRLRPFGDEADLDPIDRGRSRCPLQLSLDHEWDLVLAAAARAGRSPEDDQGDGEPGPHGSRPRNSGSASRVMSDVSAFSGLMPSCRTFTTCSAIGIWTPARSPSSSTTR